MVVRSLKWLANIIGIVVISAILSIWVSGYIVTSVVQSVLKQYEIPLTIEPIAFSGVWGMLWGYEKLPASEDVDRELLLHPDDDRAKGKQLNLDNDNGQSALNGAGEDSSIEDLYTEQEAIDVFAPVETDEEIAMTTEQFEEVKNRFENEDKERIFEILTMEMPADTWQMFSTYLEDGLTETELLEVQQVMAQHLSSQQYDELMSILKKY